MFHGLAMGFGISGFRFRRMVSEIGTVPAAGHHLPCVVFSAQGGVCPVEKRFRCRCRFWGRTRGFRRSVFLGVEWFVGV